MKAKSMTITPALVTALITALLMLLITAGCALPDAPDKKEKDKPASGNDDNKSNIYFDRVASDNKLKHTPYLSDFKNRIKEIKDNSENTVALALVYYKDNSNATHYVGVNDLHTFEGTDYIEISPTSGNDSNSSARKKSWLYKDNKIYVPVSEIKRIDVLIQKQE